LSVPTSSESALSLPGTSWGFCAVQERRKHDEHNQSQAAGLLVLALRVKHVALEISVRSKQDLISSLSRAAKEFTV